MISKLKSLMNPGKTESSKGPSAQDQDSLSPETSATDADGRPQGVAKISRSEQAVKLDIPPHSPISAEILKGLPSSARSALKFYKYDPQKAHDDRTKSHDEHKTWETQAFVSEDRKEIIAHVSPRNSGYVLTQKGFWSALRNLLAFRKTNTVTANLKSKAVSDLGASREAEDAYDSGRMKTLTEAGIVSFMVIHRADEKGGFAREADLKVPVFNLHKMLEHLKKYPPAGIKGEALTQFKADIERLEANKELENVHFIDQITFSEANKERYSSVEQLRKDLQSATDILSNDAEVFISGDLIGTGAPEANANGSEYSVVDYRKPVIHKDGKVEVANQKLTIIRNEENKDKALPVEDINRVLAWHHLIAFNDTRKLDHSPETMQALNQAHGFNANALKEFNKEVTASSNDNESPDVLSLADKLGKGSTEAKKNPSRAA